jgi:hypothetical protein
MHLMMEFLHFYLCAQNFETSLSLKGRICNTQNPMPRIYKSFSKILRVKMTLNIGSSLLKLFSPKLNSWQYQNTWETRKLI